MTKETISQKAKCFHEIEKSAQELNLNCKNNDREKICELKKIYDYLSNFR